MDTCKKHDAKLEDNLGICEYCEGTGMVEIDPLGPEEDSTVDFCECQLSSLDD